MNDLRLSGHEEDDPAAVGHVGQKIEGLTQEVGRLVL
jgi:hypothetical protein